MEEKYHNRPQHQTQQQSQRGDKAEQRVDHSTCIIVATLPITAIIVPFSSVIVVPSLFMIVVVVVVIVVIIIESFSDLLHSNNNTGRRGRKGYRRMILIIASVGQGTEMGCEREGVEEREYVC